MNKLKTIVIISAFILLVINVFGQTTKKYFEVIKSGQGTKSIIFIPGFACSGEVWNETKVLFEKDYTCHTLTMAGFAGIPPQTNTSFVNWEMSIADYIKENKIDKPVIIGHSMGGGLALALASDYPDLIGKIVVVDALPCLNALINPLFKAELNPDCGSLTNTIIQANNEQFYQMQKRSISKLLNDTTKQDLVISWGLKSDRKTFATMYCDFSNTDLRSAIANIKCPALVLLEAGFTDLKTQIETQYQPIKSVNLQYANKGLHFIMFDDKQWYLKQLEDFLSGK